MGGGGGTLLTGGGGYHHSESNKPRILENSDLGYFGKNHEKSSKITIFYDKIIKNHDF